MATLEAAKKKRAGAKSWLTKSYQKCHQLSLTDVDEIDFNAAIEDFEKRLAAWDEAEIEVENLVPVENLDAEIDAAADYRETANTAKLSLVKAWHKAHPPQQQEVTTPTEASVSSRGESSTPKARLPKIELPKFSGDVLKWTPFWQQYEACIDKEDLPAVTKFNYLVSLLRGDAKNVLDGIPVTEQNYEQAKTLLESKYGRREVIIFAHVQELLAVQIPEAADTKKLSQAYDRLMANVRSLEAQGVTANQFGVVLTPLIVSKLPEEIRLEWSRNSEKKETDLPFLLSFLELEIQRRERCQTFGGLGTVKKDAQHKERHPKSGHHGTAAALHNSQGSTSSCLFCGKKHQTQKCKIILRKPMEIRVDIVRSNQLCFRCLSKGHFSSSCKITCQYCNGNHHVTLCYDYDRVKSTDVNDRTNVTQSQIENDVESQPEQTGAAILSVNQNVSFLPTARVKVQARDGSWQTATLLFDSGADRSYVSKSLVSKVNPKWVKNTSVSFSTFGGRSQGSKSKVFELSVQGTTGCSVDLKVVEVPVICLPLSRPSVDKSVFESFNVELADDFTGGDLVIDILIGQDLFWTLMKDGVVRDPNSSVVAQETVFGWVLSGCSGEGDNHGVSMLNVSTIPEHILTRFWDLESIGIQDESDSSCFVENFSEDIVFKEGRYEVGLTWKEKHPPLLDNRSTAVSCLKRLEKRFERDPQLREGYSEAFQQMEDSGFIEEVATDESKKNPVFYLPHHPVVRKESISTKIRPVFNASCKGPNGVSLNDCLDAGPNLNPGIADVILRFRRWKFAVSADVKKAFLQIKLKEQDQDVHRFLLRKGGELRTMRFSRVAFGVNCSPFLLSATIQHHLSKYPSALLAVRELQENLYVDDFLSGADTEAEVKRLYQDADQIMTDAGMQLAKWTSNESSVLGNGIESQAPSEYVKVLGVSWEREKDAFRFIGAELPELVRCTKRVVLSLIARVFDPLGFVLPCTITARFLFQDVWRLGIAWDENLPGDLQAAFERWLRGLKFLKKISIPRAYLSHPWSECEQDIELHAFGDASLKGYGACVYIRYKDASGSVQCTLVRSCGRVAPIERKTLPRLELLACLVTAQLLNSVIKALHLSGVRYTCWSDSMVALGWIRGLPSRWKQWVANRVTTIQSLTNPENWRHVAGIENPADLVSRGVPADELVNSDLWWRGPRSLQETGTLPDCVISLPKGIAEVEKERKVKEESVLVCSEVQPTFPLERWSTLDKAFRVIAWVLRFIKRARKQCKNKGLLSSEEYSEAKLVFLKEAQRSEFNKEISLLRRGGKIPGDSKLVKLAPFLDERGVMRVRGRIQLSELSYESKHPIILPKGHGSSLLLWFIHTRKNHAGVQAMITAAREEYEIFGLRQMAKQVKKLCVPCQIVDSQACGEEAAPLPRVRVTMAPVFSVTGIDFAGPVFCSDFPGKKFYICLFVCGVVRAVHLELTESLSTEDFVLAFRRFAALKRVPSVVYSDNGKNLVGGQRLLTTYLGILAPVWRFNCPRAPWWGGWWERLVRSVKSAIKKSIRRECLSRVELDTCLCEVATSINSRPLTFVGTDTETPVPLTPNHFLSGQGSQGLESRVVEDPENVNQETLSMRHLELVERMEEFWKVWSAEYLRNLPAAVQSMRKSGNAKVGSVVLVREDGLPRMSWCFGLVTKLHYGKDGVPRAANIKTAKGEKTRAIQRLHYLELGKDSGLSDEDLNTEISGPQVNAPSPVRVGGTKPVRTAKLPSRFKDFVLQK